MASAGGAADYRDLMALHLFPHLGHVVLSRLSRASIQGRYTALLKQGLAAEMARKVERSSQQRCGALCGLDSSCAHPPTTQSYRR
jgi:hypothetical protein